MSTSLNPSSDAEAATSTVPAIFEMLSKINEKLDVVVSNQAAFKNRIEDIEGKVRLMEVEQQTTKIFVENYLEMKIGPKPFCFPKKVFAEDPIELDAINKALQNKDNMKYFVRDYYSNFFDSYLYLILDNWKFWRFQSLYEARN